MVRENYIWNCIILSFFAHIGIIFFQVSRSIDITAEVQPVPEPLQITFIPKKTAGMVAGFPVPSDQAETFVPDDSCAWSIEDQKRKLEWEQYAEENDIL